MTSIVITGDARCVESRFVDDVCRSIPGHRVLILDKSMYAGHVRNDCAQADHMPISTVRADNLYDGTVAKTRRRNPIGAELPELQHKRVPDLLADAAIN